MTAPTKPTIHIDIAEFETYLADCQGTDEEKREYLTLIYNIVCEFVTLGWGIHPIQQAAETSDKHPENAKLQTLLDADMLESLSVQDTETEGAPA